MQVSTVKPPATPKIYDCFCYFNEDMMLRLRLETLWEHVDYFVIVEATYTQTGQPKPLNFKPENFGRYQSKIRYLVAENPPGGTWDFWANENAQRNEIMRGLADAAEHDRVLISDLDEIPNPAVIHQYDPKYLRGDFQQRYYSYYLNNLLIAPERDLIWWGTKITTAGHLRRFYGGRPNSVRSWKSSGLLRSLKRSWFRQFQVQRISNGGWHFTWVLSTQDILTKMTVMAHQENNRAEWRDPHYIESTIGAGRDLVRQDRRYQVVSIDGSFPTALQSNRNAFKAFIKS